MPPGLQPAAEEHLKPDIGPPPELRKSQASTREQVVREFYLPRP